MSSLVDTLPNVQLPKVILPLLSLPESDVIIDENDTLIDQLPDPFKESSVIHSTGMRHFLQFRRTCLILLQLKKINVLFSTIYCSTSWHHYSALARSEPFAIEDCSHRTFDTYRYKFNSLLYRRAIMVLVKYQFFNESCFSDN